MGTNYYIRKKSNPDYEIHVGKMSAGWRFLMAGHIDSYDETTGIALTIAKLQDYRDLLNKYYDDAYLVDECGDKLNFNEFEKEVYKRGKLDMHTETSGYLLVNHKAYDIIFNCDFCQYK